MLPSLALSGKLCLSLTHSRATGTHARPSITRIHAIPHAVLARPPTLSLVSRSLQRFCVAAPLITRIRVARPAPGALQSTGVFRAAGQLQAKDRLAEPCAVVGCLPLSSARLASSSTPPAGRTTKANPPCSISLSRCRCCWCCACHARSVGPAPDDEMNCSHSLTSHQR